MISSQETIDLSNKNDDIRLKVGMVSFLTPISWKAKSDVLVDGILMVPPDRPEWENRIYRPTLGIRIRPYPNMSLDKYQELLTEGFTQSLKQLNERMKDYVEKALNGQMPKIEIKKRNNYTINRIQVDQYDVIKSSFTGNIKISQKNNKCNNIFNSNDWPGFSLYYFIIIS